MSQEKPTKVDQIDLMQIRLQSALLELTNERLTSLAWQKKNAETVKELVETQQQLVQLQAKEVTESLDKLGMQLEEKYGVRDEKQINWETGEIKSLEEVAVEGSTATEGHPGSTEHSTEPAGQTRATSAHTG